jgi:phenylacetate-CoA ligase
MKNFINYLFNNSPVIIQNILLSAYGYNLKKSRYGDRFNIELAAFKERESYTSQKWRDYQTIELRKLLIHAFNTVPYYYEKYKKHGFTHTDFKKFELEDLHKLPFLEKEDFRKYGRTTLLSTKKKKGSFISSSGSTGTPTSTYYSDNFKQTWFAAYESRVRNWAGVNLNMKRGMIGGKKIINKPNALPPYYRYNMAEKQTYFSAYHISESTVYDYVSGIKNNKVEYMVGYALSNYFLADLIVKNKINVSQLKAVLTSSEKLTDEMRGVFKKAYGCKTYDSDSGVEACGLISENSEGDFLWSPDTGIAEVIDNEGNIALDGELISTGLLNFDQPLIRYRISDNIKISKSQLTKSGSGMLKVDEVYGRLEDAIITKDGRKIISLYRLFLDIPHLKLAQVIQYTFVEFEINIVVDNSFDLNQKDNIKKRFYERIGDNINLKINMVSNIPKTASGKYRLTISKLKND